MKDFLYYTQKDGKYITVPPIDDLCFALKEKFKNQEERITHLQEENERIKSEKYASEELSKMEKEIKTLKEEYRNGFPISDEEVKDVIQWKIQHDKEKHNAKTFEERLKLEGISGGRFKYIFVPTSLGIIGEIQCSCGEKYCFRDLI